LDAKISAPRFEPKTGWAALPVQPPSGAWQLRAARVYRALVVNLIFFVPLAFTARLNSATWILFWILLAGAILQGIFFIVAGIRGGQLEHRERKLGYTTWTRRR